jgi:hypothetical protein
LLSLIHTQRACRLPSLRRNFSARLRSEVTPLAVDPGLKILARHYESTADLDNWKGRVGRSDVVSAVARDAQEFSHLGNIEIGVVEVISVQFHADLLVLGGLLVVVRVRALVNRNWLVTEFRSGSEAGVYAAAWNHNWALGLWIAKSVRHLVWATHEPREPHLRKILSTL